MHYSTSASEHARLDVAATNRVLRNTYLLLAITLLPTIAGAFVGALFPLVAVMGWASLIVFLGVMFGGQAIINKYRNSAAGIGWLLAFTFAMGYFFGPTIGFALGAYSNGTELVAIAFGSTAAIFFGLAGYASTTKRNLATASTAKVLSIGMWMLFTVSIVNFFFASSPVALAVSAMVIPMASGYIVYTINNIVRGGERNYITATLTLYVMLLNIFISLLNLLMAFAGNRE